MHSNSWDIKHCHIIHKQERTHACVQRLIVPLETIRRGSRGEECRAVDLKKCIPLDTSEQKRNSITKHVGVISVDIYQKSHWKEACHAASTFQSQSKASLIAKLCFHGLIKCTTLQHRKKTSSSVANPTVSGPSFLTEHVSVCVIRPLFAHCCVHYLCAHLVLMMPTVADSS